MGRSASVLLNRDFYFDEILRFQQTDRGKQLYETVWHLGEFWHKGFSMFEWRELLAF